MNYWIFQGSPDHFDVDQYLLRTRNVYWSVTRPKHQREIALGDVVYLWRASGKKGSVAGVVARATVVEACKPRSELDNPIWLYDELWRNGASERSPVKAGLAVEEVRLTPEQGMVQRRNCLADSVLAHSQIIRTRVGSNFRLSDLEHEHIEVLWSGREDFAPTADEEELDRRANRVLRKGLSAEPVGITQPKRQQSPQQVYERSPLVKAWVLQRAAGACEYCTQPGPFRDAMGQLFLEVHHIISLSDGGQDTTRNAVALCPNCHRKCHFAQDAMAVRKALLGQMEKLGGESSGRARE